MPAIQRTMGLAEWLLLLALSVIWGGSFFFTAVALGGFPPFTLVWLRVAIAAAALVLILRAVGLDLNGARAPWRDFAVMGMLNNVLPFNLIVWGQTEIASGLASILNATTPFFTVILAHWLTADEKLASHRLAGVLVGLAGVAVMIGLDALGGLGAALWAQLAVIAAAICYAFAGVFGRRFAALPPLVTATGQVSASAAMMTPIALLTERPWSLPMPSLEAWAAVLGFALVCTTLAYVIFFRILRSAGATNLLLVTLLIPVSAILLGTLLLGERLAPQHVLGMALIGLGLAAIDGRPLARLRRALSDRNSKRPTT